MIKEDEMDKKELSPTKKKIIYIVSAAAICLTAGLISFIDPESKGRDFWIITLTTLPILLGLIIATIIHDKTKAFKTNLFIIGLVLILPGFCFLNIFDFGKIIGLYLGGYWVGIKWSISSSFNDTFKDNHKNGKSIE